MIVSARVREAIEARGFQPTPRPALNGTLTIGYGRKKGVRHGQEISQTTADLWLTTDLDIIGQHVTQMLGKAPATQAEFDTMALDIFNSDVEVFRTSPHLRKHRRRVRSLFARVFAWRATFLEQALAGA